VSKKTLTTQLMWKTPWSSAETYFRLNFRRLGLCLSNTGIWRFMNASNIGTVNAVSPCLWLQIMPLSISCCRTVATAAALTPSAAAMSPDRWNWRKVHEGKSASENASH
jgi:hypothetical protein